MNTLGDLRGSAHFFAESGSDGGSHFKTGRDAPEVTVFVPPGIVVTDLEVYPYHNICTHTHTHIYIYLLNNFVWFGFGLA